MSSPESPTPNTGSAMTPQQCHTKAAEYFEQAAKAHKEAARLLEAQDRTGAQTQMKAAQEKASQGQACATQAGQTP